MKEKRIYVGKRSSSPIRISFNARITLEAKEQLEKIAKQWHMSQTAVFPKESEIGTLLYYSNVPI